MISKYLFLIKSLTSIPFGGPIGRGLATHGGVVSCNVFLPSMFQGNGVTEGPYMEVPQEIYGPYGPYMDFLPQIYGPYGPDMDFLLENMVRTIKILPF